MPGDDFNPRIPKLKRCSFCGKTSEQVRRMVAGPNVQICSECILLCQEIISDDFNAGVSISSAEIPRPREIKEVLDEARRVRHRSGGCQARPERGGLQPLQAH